MNKIIKYSLISSLLILSTTTFGSAAPNPTAPGAENPKVNPTGTAPTEYRSMEQASREYHLKGAFLRYVAKYVVFPPSSLQGSTINLCVLGQIPVFDGINSINGKVVNDRAIQVQKILNIKEAKTQHCQIVYVAKTESSNIKDIVSAIKDEPILGFGDMDNFAQQGGNMNFYIANNHLAIMTNMQSVQQSHLNIDPQMLKLVTFVPK